MSGFEFLGPQGLQDHPIAGPIVKELEEPEGQTFVVANLKPPTTEEPEITTFRIGDRLYTAWKKLGTDEPAVLIDHENLTALRITRSYLVFIRSAEPKRKTAR
ncbi:MAG: hypothetical protein DMG80_12035 [Acidobacteria bacterium]|nr:MAG: hypothetical protein DMG80_12035 [Acidobacteriota bacterium]